MPNGGREVSGWLFSRDYDQGLSAFGTHIGVAGTLGSPGRLLLLEAGDASPRVIGSTEIPRWKWQHLVFVRRESQWRIYLNGKVEYEAAAPPSVSIEQCFFGGRSDNDSNWEGRLDEISVFDRALSADEIAALAKESSP